MALDHGHGNQDVGDLRLTCRAVGFLALLTALLYLRAGLAEGFAFAGMGNVATSGWLMFLLMLAGAAGLLLAWWYERAGGALALLSGAALAVLILLRATGNPLLVAAAYSSPFIVVGLLYFVAGCRR